MWQNPQESADLLFTEEILNGKLHFLCSVKTNKQFFLSPEVKLKALFVVAVIVVVAF